MLKTKNMCELDKENIEHLKCKANVKNTEHKTVFATKNFIINTVNNGKIYVKKGMGIIIITDKKC